MELSTATPIGLNIDKIRLDFPILSRDVHGKPLVYLDNAASSQRPQAVIDAISDYYERYHSNVHRGVHQLSAEATEKYEAVREKIRQLINAGHTHEVIFTKGTTESINLVASSFGKKFIAAGDEVVISEMEHHSNIVPWQIMCEERGAVLKIIPVSDKGELDLGSYGRLLSERTRIVAISHVSNTLGTINPVKEMIGMAHEKGIPVLLDGAQAIPHMPVNVQDLNADFYAFSGHKMLGPTGIGVLYGKEKYLDAMPPYQGGGAMIRTVTFEKTTYGSLPNKFEAGTPNIADVIGLGAAIDYLGGNRMNELFAYEHDLTGYAMQELGKIEDIRLIGKARERAAVISFLVGEIHPYDLGMLLDAQGIAVRTGHHCTQPLMERFGISGTVRVSLAFYNTKQEIDLLISGIRKSIQRLH